MIPKIAHFHWVGPMNWIRMMTIATFKQHHPDWEIEIHVTDSDIGSFGLGRAQEGDWTRYKMLSERGGFSIGSDIIWLKPIPESWLEHDLAACKNGTDSIYQMALLGAGQGCDYFVQAERRSREIATNHGKLDYQALGVLLLRSLQLPEDTLDIPMAAVCPYDETVCQIYWEGRDTYLYLDDAVLGLHWYGGHPVSKANEAKAGPDADYFICKRAVESLENEEVPC